MSPQPSNRASLIEGTLRCLERLPADRVTARAIAEESGANLASIGYHFGSKDGLVTEAVVEGLDRWLADVAARLDELPEVDPTVRYERAAQAVASTRRRHTGLGRTFLAAMARAQHDPVVRQTLVGGFRKTRPRIAALLGLGSDQAGEDAAGLVHSQFVGLLFQALLDPALAIEGARMQAAQSRLRRALPAQSS